MIDLSLVILTILIAVLGAAAFFISKMSPSKGLDKDYFQKHWTLVRQMDGMAALISADKLLDEALKRSGARGETMGERLKDFKSRLSSNDSVWSAHKLRNKVVHEPDVRLRDSDVKRALGQFQRALKDLGAI